MIRQLLLVAACGALLGTDERKEKTMDDREAIQGTWALVSGERKGKPFPEEIVKNVTLIFTADKLITKNGEHNTEAIFKLDPDKGPTEIDVDMGGSVGKGIYELSGETLKIVHGEVGDDRPNQFPKPGSGLTVLVLKREKQPSN